MSSPLPLTPFQPAPVDRTHLPPATSTGTATILVSFIFSHFSSAPDSRVVLHTHGKISFPSARYNSSARQQSSRIETLNEGGFRSDGRKQYELRDITIDLSQQGTADGSAMITHGLTQVLVTVFGPREAKMRSQTLHDRAVLNVEMSVAPFSTGERRKRSRADR